MSALIVVSLLKTADAMAGFLAHKQRLLAAPSLEERAVIMDHMKQDAEVARMEGEIRQQHHKEQVALRAEKFKEQAQIQKQEMARQKQEMAKQKHEMSKRKMEQAKIKDKERVQKDKQQSVQKHFQRQQQFSDAQMQYHTAMAGFSKSASAYFAMIGGR